MLLVGTAGGENINYYSLDNNLRFAEHLYQERDYLRAAKVYEECLSESSQAKGDILYKIGLCYRMGGRNDKAIIFFRKILEEHFDNCIKASAEYQIAYSYFLSGQYERSAWHIDQTLNETKNSCERERLQILKALNYLQERKWRAAEDFLGQISLSESENLRQIASDLRIYAQKGMSLQRKSPILAGMLSTILPGAGKVYCRQYGDGLYSFTLSGATGMLSLEGFRENGVRSVKGWLFCILSAVFYAGNIYGSYISAHIYNRQMETELLSRLPAIPEPARACLDEGQGQGL